MFLYWIYHGASSSARGVCVCDVSDIIKHQTPNRPRPINIWACRDSSAFINALNTSPDSFLFKDVASVVLLSAARSKYKWGEFKAEVTAPSGGQELHYTSRTCKNIPLLSFHILYAIIWSWMFFFCSFFLKTGNRSVLFVCTSVICHYKETEPVWYITLIWLF